MNRPALALFGNLRALLSQHAAVLYGMIGRLWLVLTGPVTIIVLATHLNPHAQGYFFTFLSLAAARTVAELGLGQVIIVEMAKLRSTFSGSPETLSPRIAGLIRFTAKWFVGAGLLVGALLCFIGTFLLRTGDGLASDEWQPQWIVLAAMVGVDIALSGLLFPLEGAGHIRPVYFCRMVRSVVNSLGLWLFIVAGFQLWSISIALAASLVWTLYFLLKNGKLVIEALKPATPAERINWVSDVFPGQWRLALSSLAEYVSFYTMIPVMYVMHGAVSAGQLGVTWQIAAAISSIAGAVISTRFPEFSRLANERSIHELDKLLVVSWLISMALCLLGAVAFASCVLLFEKVGFGIASRLLPSDQVAVLMMGILVWHSNLSIMSYLRAHGGDPYLPASLGGAILLLMANLTLGQWFGPAGLLWGYTLTGACFMMPLGFYLLRTTRKARNYPPFKFDISLASMAAYARSKLRG